MKIAALPLILFIATTPAWAKESRMQEDIKTFQNLFVAAVDVDGPRLQRCGRISDRVKIFDAVKYVYGAFHKLHKGFPRTAQPLDEYLESRLAHHCEAIGCDTPREGECNTKLPDGSDGPTWSYEYAVDEVKKRLKAARLSTDLNLKQTQRPVAQGSSCSYSAQHYQDAYERAGRVSDLVCLQKALQRELQ